MVDAPLPATEGGLPFQDGGPPWELPPLPENGQRTLPQDGGPYGWPHDAYLVS